MPKEFNASRSMLRVQGFNCSNVQLLWIFKVLRSVIEGIEGIDVIDEIEMIEGIGGIEEFKCLRGSMLRVQEIKCLRRSMLRVQGFKSSIVPMLSMFKALRSGIAASDVIEGIDG